MVVDDDVDGATGGVLGQLGDAHIFVDDALTSEGGITVDDDGDGGGLGIFVTSGVLEAAGESLDEGVDGFEVRRVEHQLHAVVLAVSGLEIF